MELTGAFLAQKQSLPMEAKAIYSARRIIEFYEELEGMVYIAFSGGLDSTVTLDIARSVRPDIPAVFIDTGVEYPEIREFVRTIDNVIYVKPKKTFQEIIEQYGYPVVSKEQAQCIAEYRNTKSEKLRNTRWNGNAYGRDKISEKWKFLVNAPFKISDRCCYYLKKEPVKRYGKETGRKGIIGTRAAESSRRTIDYLKFGCNSFDSKRVLSRPLSIWTHKDIWAYIKHKNLPYSKIYDMDYDRTGCYACGFGCHLNSPNKFQIMKKTHPKLHEHCMSRLGIRKVFNFMGVPVE